MTRPLIIAVVGLTGSGKSEATEQFIKRGFVRVGFNDPIYEELNRRGLEYNEKNEREVRENLRKEFGAAVTAERSTPRVMEALRGGKNIVVESLYSWSEYKIMKERFGDQFWVAALYAPPSLRYERLARRSVRSLDPETSRSRDYAEIEPPVEKAGPIAMADWTIQNTGTRDEFFEKLDSLIDEVLKSG